MYIISKYTYHTKNIIAASIVSELMGESFFLSMLPKTQQRSWQVAPKMFVDNESVVSRMNYLNILVWSVFGHATVLRADAGHILN